MFNKRKILIYICELYKDNAFGVFLDNLYQSFEKMRFEPIYVNLNSVHQITNAISMMKRDEILFSIGINDTMLRIYDSDKTTYVYNYVDTIHVSILQDAPYSIKIGNIYAPARNHIICYLDRSHGEMIRNLELAVAGTSSHFLPMGGCTNGIDICEKMGSKKYDVAVCAGLWCGNPQRTWRNEADAVTASILDSIADYMEKHPVNIYVATKEVFAVLNLDINIMIPTLKLYLWSLLEYIKTFRRIKAVKFLVDNNIKVDVFGGGWENVPFADRLNLHGAVSYNESVEVIANSKIMFQDQAEFNDGAHDRVFTAMLNGTVVVSEYSKYLDEIFVNTKEIFLYDWLDGKAQVDVIHDLLSDDNKRLTVIAAAYKKAIDEHQWNSRAEKILKFVFEKMYSNI